MLKLKVSMQQKLVVINHMQEYLEGSSNTIMSGEREITNAANNGHYVLPATPDAAQTLCSDQNIRFVKFILSSFQATRLYRGQSLLPLL